MKEYICEISELNFDSVLAKIIDINGQSRELPIKVYLYQGLAKGDKMENIIQKNVELGVYKIVPVFSERCVVKPGKDSKIDRWQKIALEAARQSGRGIIPEVASPMSFMEALKDADDKALKLFPWEEEHGQTLKHVIDGTTFDSAAVFIGPEGGFSEDEAQSAKDAGLSLVTLGRRILRTETAGPAVLAMLLYHNEL